MLSAISKAWALLDGRERRQAVFVLAVMMLAAVASAVMVGSVFPFLSVISDPTLIHSVPLLLWCYQKFGFASDYHFVVALGLGSLVVIVLSNALMLANMYVMTRFSMMRTHTISKRLFSIYLHRPYEYFLNQHSGNMSTNILAETNQTVMQFLRPFAGLLSACLTIIAIITILMLVNPTIAIATLASFVIVYLIILAITRPFVQSMGEGRIKANSARFRISGEALGGIKDVKLLGLESRYLHRFDQPSAEMARLAYKVQMLSQTPQFALQTLAFSAIILLCLVLLDPERLYERDALGSMLPLLGVLALAAQRLMPQVQAVYGAITQMTYGAAAVERIWKDLQGPTADQEKTEVVRKLALRKELRLEKVNYTYPDAEAPGLNDVSLIIRAGERIGIVGSSGAGKTTLADTVLGLLQPQSGKMFADEVLVNAQSIRAWQRCVGYVPQDIFLIDASLSENIALGLQPNEIDDSRIEQVAKTAQLHEFALAELPNGYQTRIGERGVRLSGGQRQRIGIARALYHDADLIVFDEATSALDNMTEREVMSAIESLPGDKTILMIAHRLSTVKVCDRIVVMERGGVRDFGPWADLMARSATFRAMVEAA